MDAITVLNLRESKEAGPKVKELGEQGALVACTAINLEYGYHGASCSNASKSGICAYICTPSRSHEECCTCVLVLALAPACAIAMLTCMRGCVVGVCRVFTIHERACERVCRAFVCVVCVP